MKEDIEKNNKVSAKRNSAKIVSKMTGEMWKTLFVYSASHWIADMCAGAVVFASLLRYGYNVWDFFVLVVLYNFLSFGLQYMFGVFIDKYQVPKEATLVSFILIGLAFLAFNDPILVVLLAGIGDSLFHVGAGAISLSFTPRRPIPVGLFVAPGGIGLFCGIVIGKSSTIPMPFVWESLTINFYSAITWFILLGLLSLCAYFVAIREIPKINYDAVDTREKIPFYFLVNALLFCSVAIRSMHGLTAGFSWQTTIWLQLLLVLGIVFGKAIGGPLADRFGWRLVAFLSLLISAPLMAFGKENIILATIGMTFFQMTMPISFTIRYNIFEGRPATAFGFACLALMAGACPIYLGATTIKPIVQDNLNTLFVIIFSASAILTSMTILKDYFKKDLKIEKFSGKIL